MNGHESLSEKITTDGVNYWLISWLGELAFDWIGESLNKRVKLWVSLWQSLSVGEWVSDRIGGWVSEYLRQWVSESSLMICLNMKVTNTKLRIHEDDS